MGITLVGTLLFPIEVAVPWGILAALAHYDLRTSAPEVVSVVAGGSASATSSRAARARSARNLQAFDIHGDLQGPRRT